MYNHNFHCNDLGQQTCGLVKFLMVLGINNAHLAKLSSPMPPPAPIPLPPLAPIPLSPPTSLLIHLPDQCFIPSNVHVREVCVC